MVTATDPACAALAESPTGVAWNVIEYVPGAAPDAALIVTVAAPPLIDVESNVTVMPLGSASAEKATTPPKLLRDTTSDVVVADPVKTFVAGGTTEKPIVAGTTVSVKVAVASGTPLPAARTVTG
jgi:hypothetical protein